MKIDAREKHAGIRAGWFDRLPKAWDFIPLKRAALSIVNRRSVARTDSYVGLENIEPWTGRLIDTEVDFEADGLGGCFCNNDVLFGKLRPYLAKVHLATSDGIGSTEFLVLRGKRVIPPFLRWCLLTPGFIDSVNATTYGTKMPRANWEDIGSLLLPIPPTEEQHAIAALLDHETAKIDGLIAKQTEFLTLLDEHRRALITEAVTRGHDPSVPMRETGNETFPAIPTHWDIKPLMRLVPPSRPINYGVLMPGPSVTDGIPLIEAGDIMAGRIVPTDLRRTTPEIEAPFARSRLNPGDVVLAIRGSIGSAQVVPIGLENANVTRDAARISPRPEVEGQFIAYVLGSDLMKEHFGSKSLGAAVQGINITDLKRAPIPLPPHSEQIEIIFHLGRRLARLDTLHTRGTQMIERLRERRSALITAAVTGQIDVTSADISEVAA